MDPITKFEQAARDGAKTYFADTDAYSEFIASAVEEILNQIAVDPDLEEDVMLCGEIVEQQVTEILKEKLS